MRFISRVLATGFFSGYIPIAPGTAGSIVGLFLYWAIPRSDAYYFLILIVIVCVVGVWAAERIEKETGVKDNQIIVIDEIVGVWIALLGLQKDLKWLAIGLIIFRLFDIIKLFPAKRMEKLPRGWGVMMDDVVSGIYAALCVNFIIFVVNGRL